MTIGNDASAAPRRNANWCCIVTFHGIGPSLRRPDPGEDRYWITAESWSALFGRLSREHDLEITFDDGNRSDIEIAAPALAGCGLSATFFVVADRVGRDHFLGAGDLRELRSMGMRIGSHGMQHRPWRGLRGAALHEEIAEAKDRIEQALGDAIVEAACPFGAYDRASLAALREAGFRRVLTSDRGWARRDAWLQGRTSVTADASLDFIDRALQRPGPAASAGRWARSLVKRWS